MVVDLLRDKSDTGLAVLEIVPELLGHIHGIERDDSRIGTQDRIVSDHELGTVLHVEQDTVSFGNAQVGQIARQPIDFLDELAVGNLFYVTE